MLDEPALRRPEFREGPKIKLADGQDWAFPEPRIQLFPVRNPKTGEIEVGGGPSWGDNYRDWLDAYVNTGEDEIYDRISLQFRMASDLLLKNYTLSDQDLGRLLVIDVGSEESSQRWSEIISVLLGNLPKRLPDGSAALSSPTE